MSQSQFGQVMQVSQFESDKHLVLLDTDIGDDIDDALALALALRSPEIEFIGITTVFRDTLLRARLPKQCCMSLNGMISLSLQVFRPPCRPGIAPRAFHRPPFSRLTLTTNQPSVSVPARN